MGGRLTEQTQPLMEDIWLSEQSRKKGQKTNEGIESKEQTRITY